MLGTIVNVGCILSGSVIGSFVSRGINEKYNDEGTLITLEFENFYFVCAYVPNAQD